MKLIQGSSLAQEKIFLMWLVLDSFDSHAPLEKAVRVYADNAYNRFLKRVGLPWGKDVKLDAERQKNIGKNPDDIAAKRGKSALGGKREVQTIKDETHRQQLQTLAKDKTSDYYHLGKGVFEKITPDRIVGDTHYFSGFEDDPEGAIRFITARYAKNPSIKTVCTNVLQTYAGGRLRNIDLTYIFDGAYQSKKRGSDQANEKGIMHILRGHLNELYEFESPQDLATTISSVLETVMKDSAAKEKGGVSKVEMADFDYKTGQKGQIKKTMAVFISNLKVAGNPFILTAFNVGVDKQDKTRKRRISLKEIDAFLAKSKSACSPYIRILH